MSTSTILKITSEQVQQARELGRRRTEAHLSTKKDLTDASLKKLYDGDFWGALAEIVLIDAIKKSCKESGKLFNARYQLWHDKHNPEPDLVLLNSPIRLDVKAVSPSHRYLNIDRNDTTGPHAPDYFVVVVFEDEKTAHVLHPVPRKTVAQSWDKKTFNTGVYSCDLVTHRPPYIKSDLWVLVNPSPTKTLPTIAPLAVQPSSALAM